MPGFQEIRETFTRALAITYKPIPIWNRGSSDPLNEKDLKTTTNARRILAGAIVVSAATAGYAAFSSSLVIGVAAVSLLIISAIAVRQLSLYRTRYFERLAGHVKTMVDGLGMNKEGFDSAETLRKALVRLDVQADMKEAIAHVDQYLLKFSRSPDENESSKTKEEKKDIEPPKGNVNDLARAHTTMQDLIQFLENYGVQITELNFVNILKENEITPEVFVKAISLCPKLQKLTLISFHIDDEMMENLSTKCPDLVELKCYNVNKLTGAGFLHLAKLTKLQRLFIDFNSSTNCTDMEVRSAIAKLNNLTQLTLKSSKFLTDDTITEWAKLPLIRLELYWIEKISGKYLGSFSKLEYLDLTVFKEPTDVLFQELQKLKSLKELVLFKVNCTVDEIKALITHLTSLERITFQSCPLITEVQVKELKAQFPAIVVHLPAH